MKENQIKDIKEFLSSPKKISIIPHKNPDGDAIGSSLGLMHYLKKLGHTVHVISPNEYPNFLKWMPGNNEVIKFDYQEDYAKRTLKASDLIFTLDFNSLSRIEEMKPYLESLDVDFAMIDHHQQPDGYAKYTYSDVSMSATCEMIYNFISYLGDLDQIDADIATCLYAGIMTDTGSFRFSSTTSTTHRIIADLIDKGAKNTEIHNAIFDSNSIDKLHLLGVALNNLVFLEAYNMVYITLTKAELEKHNFKKGDTEGFVNYGLSIEGVKLSIIFIENNDGDYIKISLRSKGDFSVNEMARKHFNGGGHINAAGGRSDMNMEDTINKLNEILPSYQKELQ
ncbi:phosphoesterase RecJ domain-containing protein [Zhouia amylolytica]|uniref:Phosphoesterase RecJ domain-containing protein n=1 Tax=Zhouia amylolytica TaxID=376730 RepID=A0A1I6QB80_9FLAO|nr:bifunctional oligoribonuclease/PAP phosphatase NrnA [Zhouia amylolytica]MCQ0111364.1 bifunctional oligoribonuclease/PAP phosphatase NrnA [Zhouia amylolytica]SFS49716.1 phosphoesterase RecJ domain-containing protein [Zhouia amylolytica]